MSRSKNKTHGGKGVITPSVKAVSNFRNNFEKIDWGTPKVTEFDKAFELCTTQKATANGHTVTCRKGFFFTSGPTRTYAVEEAKKLFSGYYADGEYAAILSNSTQKRRIPTFVGGY